MLVDIFPFACFSKLRSFNGGALGLFILSEMLQGMAQSPKFTLSMTYMDDNAKDKSPFFFGKKKDLLFGDTGRARLIRTRLIRSST